MRFKIELYILSLWVLFFLLFANKIQIPFYFGQDWQFVGTWNLLNKNWIPVFCLIGMGYGFYIFLYRFKHKVLDSGKKGPWEIAEIETISFENLSFLATYIIPLLCFDLDFHLDEGRNAFMLILVLFAIGAIYIKANLYYTNPSLALLNYKIYTIQYSSQQNTKKCIALSKEKLTVGDVIFAKHIDENVYFIRKKRDDE